MTRGRPTTPANYPRQLEMALSMKEAALMHEDFALPVEESINDADTVALLEPPAPATSDPFMVHVVGEPALPSAV